MNVLISNDDGYNSEGIIALYTELASEYNTFVVAPLKEMSASSRAMSINFPLKIKRYESKVVKGLYSVNGTPVDCVKVAFDALFGTENINVVVSGINSGINTGIDIHYSGTVGAAMEGYLCGKPSFAVSVDVDYGKPDFVRVAYYTRYIIKYLMVNFSPPYLFNINFPDVRFETYRGIRFTRPNRFSYINNQAIAIDMGKEVEYSLCGYRANIEGDEFTDYISVKNGYISITPVSSCVLDSKIMNGIIKRELSLDEII